MEVIYLARGNHPFKNVGKSTSGWVVSLSRQVQRDVAQSKILNYLNPEWIVDVVMSELILDGQPFSNIVYYNGTSGYFNSISSVAAPGNFETSSIKEWLNGGFYSSAFSAKEEEAFLFLREPIFLLYKKDAQNTELGFAPGP